MSEKAKSFHFGIKSNNHQKPDQKRKFFIEYETSQLLKIATSLNYDNAIQHEEDTQVAFNVYQCLKNTACVNPICAIQQKFIKDTFNSAQVFVEYAEDQPIPDEVMLLLREFKPSRPAIVIQPKSRPLSTMNTPPPPPPPPSSTGVFGFYEKTSRCGTKTPTPENECLWQ
ncbi:Oidioi.mRNA.OKI2018_I69.PAR.g11543.t1.cds [Oikopleura dioica]|uniref:Oidioi.mRNA.OKI2018_I69.PAR.g11543.t1.cds n=1 Tax=Oikopleura dioica TaxID=34765 RepID=A0ABN7RW55_OIKDI|nr:Oidioi.mRNA.OKI2018_I69.PAR.g11543.t1.cds [Oikopleura dioica]